MTNWITSYWKSSRQTKLFIWNWIFYALALILSTFYVYGRLDFVRSYKMPPPQIESKK